MNKIFPIDSLNETLRMHECGTGNYWFYHKGSFPDCEPLYYKYLIKNANSYIEIWDPYFNVSNEPGDQNIFDEIPKNITLKILTLKGLVRSQSYLTDVLNSLKIKIPASKNIRFGLRLYNLGDDANQGNWFFHDRYLIIDQKDVYLIGSSVEWHIRSVGSTGIFKINNIETSQFIISIFNEYWKNALRHEIPVQFLHS